MKLLDIIIIVFIFFSIAIIAHIFVCKFIRPKGFMLTGLILGGVNTFDYALYMLYIDQFDFIGIYILFSLWLFYLMVLINILNSVTLKMLACLYDTPLGALNTQDFGQVFNTEDGLETRISMLQASKLIQQEGMEIKLTPKAKFLLTIIQQLKALFILTKDLSFTCDQPPCQSSHTK